VGVMEESKRYSKEASDSDTVTVEAVDSQHVDKFVS